MSADISFTKLRAYSRPVFPVKRVRKVVTAFALGILLPLVLVIVWEYLSVHRLISPILFPAPSRILSNLVALIGNGKLLGHSATSVNLQLQGMLFGTLAGISIGIILGLWNRAEETVETSLIIMQAIPTMAIIPLLILWLDGGQLTRVLVVSYSVFFPVYLATNSAVRQVDRKLVEVGRCFSYTRWQKLKRIILPSALPQIFIGIRQSLKMGWVGVVAAEMLIAADSGIYFMMMEARSFGQTAVVYIGLITFAVLGLASDVLVTLIEKLLMPWQSRNKAGA